MSIRHNKKNNKGFTLVESLAALIMISLVTGLFVTITNFAMTSYSSLETDSEGQVLSSILVNSIQDELRYASNVDKISSEERDNLVLYSDENGTSTLTGTGYHFTYYSNALGCGANCKLVSSEGRIYVLPNAKDMANLSKAGILTYNVSGTTNPQRQSLTGKSSYVLNLRAYVDAYYVPTEKSFYVTLVIGNEKMTDDVVNAYFTTYGNIEDTNLSGGSADKMTGLIMTTTFVVESLNKDKLY